MKKILMIVDSFTGLTKKEAESLGYAYIPQIIILDGKAYKDGINIFPKNSVDLLKNIKEFKTSVPPIGEIMELIENNVNKYEHIIYWPMNKGITSTYNNIMTIANQYDNVYVADIKMYSTPLNNTITIVKKRLEEGASIEEVFEYIKKINDKVTQYVLPKTVSGLIKGGRLRGVKKAILEKGKLLPKLKWTNDGLKTVSIKRNFKKMVLKTIEQLLKDVESGNFEWEVIHTGDQETKKLAVDAIKEMTGITPKEKFIPPVIAVHIGYGGIGIATYPKQEK